MKLTENMIRKVLGSSKMHSKIEDYSITRIDGFSVKSESKAPCDHKYIEMSKKDYSNDILVIEEIEELNKLVYLSFSTTGKFHNYRDEDKVKRIISDYEIRIKLEECSIDRL